MFFFARVRACVRLATSHLATRHLAASRQRLETAYLQALMLAGLLVVCASPARQASLTRNAYPGLKEVHVVVYKEDDPILALIERVRF